jgi:hypothetical protein
MEAKGAALLAQESAPAESGQNAVGLVDIEAELPGNASRSPTLVHSMEKKERVDIGCALEMVLDQILYCGWQFVFTQRPLPKRDHYSPLVGW